jgi:hypothetical protein
MQSKWQHSEDYAVNVAGKSEECGLKHQGWDKSAK